MSNLLTLTQDYVTAFDNCDIDAVAACFADDFIMSDNVVRNLGPKTAALEFINSLFKGVVTKLTFRARKVHVVDKETSIIEFDLRIDAMQIEGVDVVKWRDGKMISLHAYLNVLN